ncbi:MAG: hypothetical protein M4D85_02625, partial [Actinomycetota bacterium]|nr:hypothetical protein [Actinomycetota bacterium]
LDLEVRTAMRTTDPDELLACARSSGRSFSTFIDQLAWPQSELKQIQYDAPTGSQPCLSSPTASTS